MPTYLRLHELHVDKSVYAGDPMTRDLVAQLLEYGLAADRGTDSIAERVYQDLRDDLLFGRVPLGERFAHQRQLAVLEVAQAAVDHPRGRRAAARGEVVALHQQRADALQREVAIDADAVDARSDAELARAQANSARADASSARQAENAALSAAATARHQAELAAQTEADLRGQIVELNARPTERGLVVTLGDVLFDSGKASLKNGSSNYLDKLALFLNAYPERTAEIEGHTDDVGSDAANMLLSQRRADTVKAFLLGQGVAGDRLDASGKGEAVPLAANTTADGRQLNRRVEVIIANAYK